VKNYSIHTAALMLGLMTATLGYGTSAVADAKNPVIAVSMKTQVQRRWAFDVRAMELEAQRQGAQLIVQWANDDPALQASQVENLLSQNPDALIMVAVDSQAGGRIVRSAREQGVPVIGYDIGISTVKLDYFVMRNNAQVGQLHADAALAFAPNGTFAVFKGDPANDVAQAIGRAYEAPLINNPNVKIVFNQFIRGWDPTAAMSNAENVLSAQSDRVDGFVVSNDGMAQGVAQAIKARDLDGKVLLTGMDADVANLRLIAQGVQTMSVWTDLEAEGSAAVKAAVALARKQPFPIETADFDLGAGPVPTHQVRVIPVTKASLCDFVTREAPRGWTTPEEVFEAGAAACQ